MSLINRWHYGSLGFHTKDFAVNITVRRIRLWQDKGKRATVGHYYTWFLIVITEL